MSGTAFIPPVLDVSNLEDLIRDRYITRDEVEEWMNDRGWSRTQAAGKFCYIWSYNVDGEDDNDASVKLPHTEKFNLYIERMVEAFVDLTEFHECLRLDIIRDIVRKRKNGRKELRDMAQWLKTQLFSANTFWGYRETKN